MGVGTIVKFLISRNQALCITITKSTYEGKLEGSGRNKRHNISIFNTEDAHTLTDLRRGYINLVSHFYSFNKKL